MRKPLISLAILMIATSTVTLAADDNKSKPSIESLLLRDEFSGRDGAKEAAHDLENNCARYCIYGRSAGLIYLADWNELSGKKFGVKVEAIAGCAVTKNLVSYAKNYNRVVLAYVAEKYGETAWSDCLVQAAKSYDEKTRQTKQ